MFKILSTQDIKGNFCKWNHLREGTCPYQYTSWNPVLTGVQWELLLISMGLWFLSILLHLIMASARCWYNLTEASCHMYCTSLNSQVCQIMQSTGAIGSMIELNIGRKLTAFHRGLHHWQLIAVLHLSETKSSEKHIDYSMHKNHSIAIKLENTDFSWQQYSAVP